MGSRVFPLCEGIRGSCVACGDVFSAIPARVITKKGHSSKRIATEAIGVAEVIVVRHVCAHPFAGVGEYRRELKGGEARLQSIIIH